VKKHKKYKTN